MAHHRRAGIDAGEVATTGAIDLTAKTKTSTPLLWRRVKKKALDLFDGALLGIAVGLTILTLFLSSSHSDSPYQFCLSEAGGDSCEAIPGRLSIGTSQDSPDKLLVYFSGLPERVHQQWRVWIKDMSVPETIEMTVSDFHAWVDSVWLPLGRK